MPRINATRDARLIPRVLWVAGTLLAIGCYQPQRLPPPGSIPYGPDPSTQNLLIPAVPPTTGAPLSIPSEKSFAWPADVPLKEWRYIVLHHTASTSGSVA